MTYKNYELFESLMEEAIASPEGVSEDKTLEIIDRINNRLEESQISRKEFARRMGVSSPAVTQFLDGTSSFTIRTLAKIACALEIDIDRLFVGRKIEAHRFFDSLTQRLQSQSDSARNVFGIARFSMESTSEYAASHIMIRKKPLRENRLSGWSLNRDSKVPIANDNAYQADYAKAG